jgi:DNA-binding FadR family transcriptional regulator
VARKLEETIVKGGLPPGSRLGTKDDLRKQFGVAVATVNEAVRVLELSGLVEARPGPGGGVFVAGSASRVRLNHMTLSFKWADAPFGDLLAVRNALEAPLFHDASRHGTARDYRALRKTVDEMAATPDSPTEYLALNWQFHRRVAKMCRNGPLQSLYLMLLDFVESALEDVASTPSRAFEFETNVAIHAELIAAMEAKDEDRLDAALKLHAADAAPLDADTDAGRRGRRVVRSGHSRTRPGAG